MTIEFEVYCPKMISVNDQYMHPVKKTKKGKYVSYTCKSPSLKDFQSFYGEVLKDKISDSDISQLKSEISNSIELGLDLFLEVGLPLKEINEHDASNFIKALEDCIAVRLGVDDSRNIQVSIKKSILEDPNWKLRVRISTSKISKYDEEVINETKNH